MKSPKEREKVVSHKIPARLYMTVCSDSLSYYSKTYGLFNICNVQKILYLYFIRFCSRALMGQGLPKILSHRVCDKSGFTAKLKKEVDFPKRPFWGAANAVKQQIKYGVWIWIGNYYQLITNYTKQGLSNHLHGTNATIRAITHSITLYKSRI